MSTAPLASIVIVNWNGLSLLQQHLSHVVELTQAEDSGHEIIVVDNGSTDGSVAMVRDRFPGVRILALPENFGFSKGNNLGAREARNPILVFMNNDVRPMPGFLAPVLKWFSEPDVFAVAMKSLVPADDMQEEATMRLALRWGWWGFVPDARVLRGGPGPIPILHACAGMAACDRLKFLELGGFDEMFSPVYWEDFDLSLRAWRRGWRVLYEPSSVVHHHRGSTSKRPERKRFTRTMDLKNHHLVVWKHLDGAGPWMRYFFWTGVRLARAAVKLDAAFFEGLYLALKQAGEAVEHRRSFRKEATHSTSEVLTLLDER